MDAVDLLYRFIEYLQTPVLDMIIGMINKRRVSEYTFFIIDASEEEKLKLKHNFSEYRSYTDFFNELNVYLFVSNNVESRDMETLSEYETTIQKLTIIINNRLGVLYKIKNPMDFKDILSVSTNIQFIDTNINFDKIGIPEDFIDFFDTNLDFFEQTQDLLPYSAACNAYSKDGNPQMFYEFMNYMPFWYVTNDYHMYDICDLFAININTDSPDYGEIIYISPLDKQYTVYRIGDTNRFIYIFEENNISEEEDISNIKEIFIKENDQDTLIKFAGKSD